MESPALIMPGSRVRVPPLLFRKSFPCSALPIILSTPWEVRPLEFTDPFTICFRKPGKSAPLDTGRADLPAAILPLPGRLVGRSLRIGNGHLDRPRLARLPAPVHRPARVVLLARGQHRLWP